MVNFVPLCERVVIKPIEQESTTKGGIFLPDTAKEKPQEGEVVAVGPGRVSDDGSRIAMELSKGDKVIYSKIINLDVLTLPLAISSVLMLTTLIVAVTAKCPQRLGKRFYKLCVSVLNGIASAGPKTFGISTLISTFAVFVTGLSMATVSLALVHVGALALLVFICSLPITVIPITPGGIGLPDTIVALAFPKLASPMVAWRILNLLTVMSVAVFTIAVGGQKLKLIAQLEGS